ncbi:MAG TPA: hypothetical protein VK550_06795 [Polyangiaceae bacterium]|nr:hypothetical protein [Polyangiaceae bacterium]
MSLSICRTKSLLLAIPLFAAFIGPSEAAAVGELDATDQREQELVPSVWANQGRYASRWVEEAFQAVRDQKVGVLPAARLYAMVTVAIYDAVNGIDRARWVGREQALVPPTGAPLLGLRAAAAAAAAHTVLVSLTPAQSAVLDQALAADLAELGGTSSTLVARGRDWGVQVGQQVIARRASDGTQVALTLPASTAPGAHRTDYDARYSIMTPFGIATKDAYQAPPPPALTSDVYTASFLDSKAVGTHDGNPVNEEIATFWGGEDGTARESGNWLQAAVAIARQRSLERSISATARLYAMVGMATADGGIVSHDAKADYFTWRVVPAIHEADIDGNAATIADPAWVPRNGTGNLGSPEYTSGAAAFAGASSAAIERFFCSAEVSFCFATDVAPSARCYATPLAAAEEGGRARVLQGVHFQFSVNAAIAQSRGVGAEIGTKRLRRVLPSGRIVPACSP